MQILDKIGPLTVILTLKAAVAFVWPLIVKAMQQIINDGQYATCMQTLNKIGP